MMSLILTFKACGLKAKKGVLFGEYRGYEIFTVHALFLKATFFDKSTSKLLVEAMDGLVKDKEWMTKNMPVVWENCRLGRDHAYAEAKKAHGKEMEMLRQNAEAEHQENVRLRTENHTLRKAISIVQEGE